LRGGQAGGIAGSGVIVRADPARLPAVKARLDESEQNVGMLKSGIMQLLRFLEGKKA